MLVPDIVSSEDDDEESGDIMIVRPLPWRSSAVNNFFLQLDEQSVGQKSSQAKRQMKKRVLGSASARLMPEDGEIPLWAFSANSSSQ